MANKERDFEFKKSDNPFNEGTFSNENLEEVNENEEVVEEIKEEVANDIKLEENVTEENIDVNTLVDNMLEEDDQEDNHQSTDEIPSEENSVDENIENISEENEPLSDNQEETKNELSEENLVIEEDKFQIKYVKTVEDFISLIENGHDEESIFFEDPKLYKDLYKEIKKKIKEDLTFAIICLRMHLRNEINVLSHQELKHIINRLKKREDQYNYYMGEMYRYGIDTRKNLKKALSFYEKSSELGYIWASVQLSEFYLFGLIEQDYQKAYDYIASLPRSNYKVSLLLARMIQYGIGVEKNEKGAFLLYSQLYDKDYLPSYFYISEAYFFGKGIEKNIELALEIAKKGVSCHDKHCELIVALSRLYGIGNKKDFKKGRKDIIKLVDDGIVDGCYYLGIIHNNGEHCFKSYSDAYDTFSYGKEHYSLICQLTIEERYRKGWFGKMKIKKEFKKPIKLIEEEK